MPDDGAGAAALGAGEVPSRTRAACGRDSCGFLATRRSRWIQWRGACPPPGVAVGRKNHYGSRSERGTRVAALFYSLMESSKLCGVEPRAYLREAARQAVRNPGTVTLARDLK